MQDPIIANGAKKQTEWRTVNWREAYRNVRNLRQRIFRATQERNFNKVRSLQKLMLKSYSNVLVSVRRVTQVNNGKHTAGIDKIIVKTPEARSQLVKELTNYQIWKAKPARRVYIPKATGKHRPLGIPTIKDRCLQAMVKNALEPHWENRFEGTSYGFRPGRGCHDAIEAVFLQACPHRKRKWIVDADIKGAFDNISHQKLLKIIGDFPAKEIIRQWLKAGYIDKNVFYDTEAGTPQGGVISPLLANVALHGMEKALEIERDKHGYIKRKCRHAVIRYADDFVVFCETKREAEKVIETLKEWLKRRGLELSEEKTRIVHITEGFNFLGFNVRQYKKPNTKQGYKLLIKPSKESVKKIRKRLKQEWRSLSGSNAKDAVIKLNPIIRGWANYFRIKVASKTFSSLDYFMYRRAYRYAKKNHSSKTGKWLARKYWGSFHKGKESKWVFGDKESGSYLLFFRWFTHKDHILVKGTSSPDDPSLKDYWRKREIAKTDDLSKTKIRIAKAQNFICPVCKDALMNGEELHIHHIKTRKNGGKENLKNLILLHLYCHQQIHANKPLAEQLSVA
jgi:RNA-directed DNA polymerase